MTQVHDPFIYRVETSKVNISVTGFLSGIIYLVLSCLFVFHHLSCLSFNVGGFYTSAWQPLIPGLWAGSWGAPTHKSSYPTCYNSMGRLQCRISPRNSSQTPSLTKCISVIKSFWNFAQSTAVILPCCVQNIKMIWWLRYELWRNDFLIKFTFKDMLKMWYPIV